MATYAQNAHRRELMQRRRGADARDREIHRAFDLMAQDKTPKSARPVFSVVGEGSRSANENYVKGWERTFGRNLSSRRLPPPPSSVPAVATG
jgi:hypothetical protein